MRAVTTLFAVILTGFAAAAVAVPDDPAKVTPLAVGSTAPAVMVRGADGSLQALGPSFAKPTILIFYRGGWCPYCNRHLGVLKKVEPDILKLGFDLLFLSADRPELLYSSLKEPDIHYRILSDAEMHASRAFGIAYHVDDASVIKMREYGVDLEQASGQAHHELPVPAVFIIDRSGVIRFVHANPDYTTRISPEELLRAAQAVVANKPRA